MYLHDEKEGKIVLDFFPPKTQSDSNQPAKVVLILHGVTGKSEDDYVLEMVGKASERGYNCVVMNHYAPPGEKDLRLMDFTQNKHLDEVVKHVADKFSSALPCELFMVGFSLGGNFALRWLGSSSKDSIESAED